jgi:hypothetical protein
MQQSFMKFPVLAISLVLFLGCKKEVNETTINSNIHSNVKAENGNKIRLVSVVNQFNTQTFSYNVDGLMDEWYVSGIEFTTKVEYDDDGRFARSLVYVGSTLAYTIFFVYEKNQVVKEIWYNGSTNTVFDEVLYTFDSNGTILKSESIIQDYYSLYEYSKDRQLSLFTVYIGGVPIVETEYTYLLNYKNPFDAIPGFTYAFIFFDGVYYANKFYSTSASSTYFDENGKVLFEDFQDPALTTMQPGPQHYPVAASYFNIALGSYLSFTFTYENCGACAKGKIGKNSANGNSSLKASLSKFLTHDPKVDMRQKAAELRADVRKFNK